MNTVPQYFGALDIGSNSFNLSLVRIDPEGHWEKIGRHKEIVRLAHDLDADGLSLSEAAIDRAIEALRKCLNFARGKNAPLSAVATSALREARNRDVLLRRAHDELGLDIRVISGEEEARLIWTGLHADPTLAQQSVLSFDIGGGSIELCGGRGNEPQFAISLPLGGVRLAGHFFPDGRTSPESITACRQWIDERLQPVLGMLQSFPRERTLATAGTMGALMKITLMRRDQQLPPVLNGARASREDMLDTCELVLAHRDIPSRSTLPAIDATRVDILPAGALLVSSLIHHLDLSTIEWRDAGVREGTIRNYLRSLRKAAA